MAAIVKPQPRNLRTLIEALRYHWRRKKLLQATLQLSEPGDPVSSELRQELIQILAAGSSIRDTVGSIRRWWFR